MILIIEDNDNISLNDIEIGKFYRYNGLSFPGRIGDDFLWDFDFCGECIRNNGIIAMIRFGNLKEDRYHEIYSEHGVSKHTVKNLEEITIGEYKGIIDIYNDLIKSTIRSKYPMPIASV